MFAAGGCAVSRFSVRCIRSCAPFSWGLAGRIRWWTIPRRIHQALSSQSPWMPVEAKGGPLSLRMASGMPTSSNKRSNTGLAPSVRTLASPFTPEDVPAEKIDDRQGEAVHAVTGSELALEVRGPEVVRRERLGRRDSRVLPPRPSSPPLDEAMPVQDVGDRAARRELLLRVLGGEDAEQLASAPPHLLSLRHDEVDDVVGGLVWAADPAARKVIQTPLGN
jgi:hypothetical protein